MKKRREHDSFWDDFPDDPNCKHGVYFISAGPLRIGSYVKIGVTANIENRISALQTGCPEKINVAAFRVIHSQKYAFFTEKTLQKDFLPLRSHGEWFVADKVMIRCIEVFK